ncbi:MAG: glycosyltransferase [Clostridiales bacterium]|nr:glycosyltransferase [Clostridiales bacterium]
MRNEKRCELNIEMDAIVLLSVGELNQNKNHELVIKALSELDKNIHYVIAGEGIKKEYLYQLAKECGVEDQIHLLGYRNDVMELYLLSDIFAFPSFREGLSVSLMEAMASGLPCAVSEIRGNVDLIDSKGGSLFDPNDVDSCARAIENVLDDKSRQQMGEYNAEKVKDFEITKVLEQMEKAYRGG